MCTVGMSLIVRNTISTVLYRYITVISTCTATVCIVSIRMCLTVLQLLLLFVFEGLRLPCEHNLFFYLIYSYYPLNQIEPNLSLLIGIHLPYIVNIFRFFSELVYVSKLNWFAVKSTDKLPCLWLSRIRNAKNYLNKPIEIWSIQLFY